MVEVTGHSRVPRLICLPTQASGFGTRQRTTASENLPPAAFLFSPCLLKVQVLYNKKELLTLWMTLFLVEVTGLEPYIFLSITLYV